MKPMNITADNKDGLIIRLAQCLRAYRFDDEPEDETPYLAFLKEVDEVIEEADDVIAPQGQKESQS